MAGEASTKRHLIRRLTSPHDRITSSCWRSRQNQFQHKLRRHPRTREARTSRKSRHAPRKSEVMSTRSKKTSMSVIIRW
jgi:hypothetical protein